MTLLSLVGPLGTNESGSQVSASRHSIGLREMAVLTRHESLPAWLVEFLEATPTSIASPRTGSATCAGWLSSALRWWTPPRRSRGKVISEKNTTRLLRRRNLWTRGRPSELIKFQNPIGHCGGFVPRRAINSFRAVMPELGKVKNSSAERDMVGGVNSIYALAV